MNPSTMAPIRRRVYKVIARQLAGWALCLVVTAAPAQKLLGLRLDRATLLPGQFVEVSVEVDLGPRSRCGVHLSFGDGEDRDINAEHPVELQYKKYERPGRYVIRVVGKALNRGFISPEACASTVSISIDVLDAAAPSSRDTDRENRLRQREDALDGKAGALKAAESQLGHREREADARLAEAGRKLDERERRVAAREAQLAARANALPPVAAPAPGLAAVPPPAAAPAPAPTSKPAKPIKTPKDDSLKVWN